MKKSDSYESKMIEDFRKKKNMTESVKLIAKYILKNK